MRNFESIGLIFVGAVSFSILLFALIAGIVEAHFLGYDSVDDCEIRWDDHTKYDTERIAAQNAWEALSGDDDCVDLEPDTWLTIEDLEWFDVNRPDLAWPGLYVPQPGSDNVNLNTPHMDTYSSCSRKFVTMHELGHAHGLAHSFGDNVMNGEEATDCTLGPHDISDYEELWDEQ